MALAATSMNTAADQLVEAYMTATSQNTNDSRIDDETLASFDLYTEFKAGTGKWSLHIEGNSTPSTQGSANQIGDANGDAGSALDSEGSGRVQVSELYFDLPYGNVTTLVGLLNPTAFLDQSKIANDENTQFIGTAFVNNPTIAFPDYTLGATLQYQPNFALNYTLFVSSSHGLADNPDTSYSELSDLDADDKGTFVAGQVISKYPGNTLRAGIWLNTSAFEPLDDSDETASNGGVFVSADTRWHANRYNLRLGWANPSVSEAAAYAALAWERSLYQGTLLGAAYAYTWLSYHVAEDGKQDASHGEVYMRFFSHHQLQATGSLQWIRHCRFDATSDHYNANLRLVTLRLHSQF